MLTGPVSTKSILTESWNRTLVVGHRGAAAYKPENTIPAFNEGIASGANAVECDVHLSKDGEMMIIHDSTLDRTFPLKGKVVDHLASEMTAVGVPTLSELIETTKNRCVLIIELKGGDGLEPKVVQLIREKKVEDQVIIFSFDSRRLEAVEKLAPELKTIWLVGAKVDPTTNFKAVFDERSRAKVDGLGFGYTNCPKEIVEKAQEQQLPVFVWTVPPGPEVDRLKNNRVNFIITDAPRDVKAQLNR